MARIREAQPKSQKVRFYREPEPKPKSQKTKVLITRSEPKTQKVRYQATRSEPESRKVRYQVTKPEPQPPQKVKVTRPTITLRDRSGKLVTFTKGFEFTADGFQKAGPTAEEFASMRKGRWSGDLSEVQRGCWGREVIRRRPR